MNWENDNFIPEVITKKATPPPKVIVAPKIKSPKSLKIERLSNQVKIQNPIFNTSSADIAAKHSDLIATFNPFDLYTIKQTVHHGDKLCNYFLRGLDTIELYENMYIKSMSDEIRDHIQDPEEESVYFLPLFYMNYPNDKEKHDYDCLTLKELFKLYNPIKYYQKELRLEIEDKINNNDLDFFRKITWNYIQNQLKLMKRFPKAKNYFVVYRGVDDDFIQNFTNPNSCYYFHSYQSTSVMYPIALRFAKDSKNPAICTFWVHPDCTYVYVDSISKYHELEFLLAPGHRAIFLYKSNQNDNYHFMILPPDNTSDLTRVKKIDEHIKTQVIHESFVQPGNINQIYQTNVNEYPGPSYASDGGRRRKNKTRKQKKQKGGDIKNSFVSGLDLVTESPITQVQVKERERLFKLISM